MIRLVSIILVQNRWGFFVVRDFLLQSLIPIECSHGVTLMNTHIGEYMTSSCAHVLNETFTCVGVQYTTGLMLQLTFLDYKFVFQSNFLR